MELVKYEAARVAIYEANSVDEVKEIKDRHEAMRAYAKQSGDFELANQCAEIRIRAERRLGQMLKEQKENNGMAKPGPKIDQSHDGTELITPTLADMGITKNMSSRAQTIASVPEEQFEEVIADFKDQQKELTSNAIKQLTDKPHVSHNSGENEWYTPACYIESARLVMGSINLDPASSELANKTVNADQYATIENSGLDKVWSGTVWLNPPYAQPLIAQFVDHLIYNINTFDQACVLVNNGTETLWFQSLLVHCDHVCFIKGRIKFIDKEGIPSGSPLQGQAIFYFGANKENFVSEFTQHGVVL